jgi:general secretion pathway protein G
MRRSHGPSTRSARSEQGYSFVELLIVTAILFILASAVVPLAQVTSQRQRESELRASLRQVRTAIDKFKDAVDAGRIAQSELSPGSEGYPPDLETLVEGVPIQNDQSGAKLKFLRKIPTDPVTNSTEWGCAPTRTSRTPHRGDAAMCSTFTRRARPPRSTAPSTRTGK